MISSVNMEQKPWFQEWFDSPYYHLLYAERDENEARYFIDNLLSSLKLPSNARILDLACGNGRHAVYLAELGFDVIGVDIAEKQIKQAKPYEKDNLAFYQHDMREPFNFGQFDLILNLFTSFGYFEKDEDHKKVIRNVEASLVNDGYFVIDFMNVNYILNNLQPKETIQKAGRTFYINRYLENDFVKKKIVVEESGKNLHFKEKVRALTYQNFEEYMKGTNFTIEKLYGDYDLNEFDPKSSERLILIVQKRNHA